jgi:hypothetical protein
LPLPTPHREVPSSHGGRPKDNEQLTAASGGYPPRRRPVGSRSFRSPAPPDQAGAARPNRRRDGMRGKPDNVVLGESAWRDALVVSRNVWPGTHRELFRHAR